MTSLSVKFSVTEDACMNNKDIPFGVLSLFKKQV